MEIRSLGYRTDLIFPHFDSEVIDQGEYLVIRTPSNPSFHWGNFLLFSAPPAEGDAGRWRRLFAAEVGTQPTLRHQAFGWDTTDGETGVIREFLDAGFRLKSHVVLTAGEVHRPPKFNTDVVVRPLRDDWEWAGALDTQIACHGAYSLPGYTVFMTRQMERYRAMVHAGLGEWYGAFLGDRVAGGLGVFVTGDVGRFQSVGTHPDFRRRGVCGTLVYEAARHAFANLGARTLVMAADEGHHAAGIYESVGFMPTERQSGMDWWEQTDS